MKYFYIITFCLFAINSLVAQQRSVVSTTSKVDPEIVFSAGEAVVNKLEGANLTLYQGFIMPLFVPAQSPPPSEFAPNSLLVIPEEIKTVRIWPNPVTTGGMLTISGLGVLAEIKLWTLQGSKVESTVSGTGPGTVEIPIYEQPGLYLIEVKTSIGTVKKKIIVR